MKNFCTSYGLTFHITCAIEKNTCVIETGLSDFHENALQKTTNKNDKL